MLERVEEHHGMVWQLSELQGLDPADKTFDAKATVLIENVRHHVEKEEDEWFPGGPQGDGPQVPAGARAGNARPPRGRA